MANATTILDTSAGETGTTYTLKIRDVFGGKGTYIDATIGSGDTIVFEGKLTSGVAFKTIATITASSVFLVDLPLIYRARRTVDGGADSTIVLMTPDVTGVV